MANKNLVFGLIVASMMIISVSFTGCMGASTAPATSVAGAAISGANPTDEYPYLTVGKPMIVKNRCLVKDPDKSVRDCTDGEMGAALVNPSYIP
ncbi:hypothetical protein M0Q50_02820 [bacterium]|jgi:hypothetical protein|nr:hypothetical protein [bacterium]